MTTILFACAIFLVWPSAARAGEVVRDYTWALANRQKCVDHLFQTEVAKPPGTMMLSISMSSGACGERKLTAVLDNKGVLAGESLVVVRGPILEQLVDLHTVARDASWEEICSRIAVVRARLSVEALRKLGSLRSELAALSLPLLSATGSVVDGGQYSLAIDTDQWELHLSFADVRSTEKRWAVTAWIENRLAAVDLGCEPP